MHTLLPPAQEGRVTGTHRQCARQASAQQAGTQGTLERPTWLQEKQLPQAMSKDTQTRSPGFTADTCTRARTGPSISTEVPGPAALKHWRAQSQDAGVMHSIE